LGKSLGEVPPTSVARPENQGSGQTVVVEFDKADTSKLADVTREAVEKQMAILLEGQVVSAAVVKDPITTSELTLAFGTPSQAEQVAAALGSSPTP
jgi:preprotein translocase subunit SecD